MRGRKEAVYKTGTRGEGFARWRMKASNWRKKAI
jgi:hypothetical protein